MGLLKNFNLAPAVIIAVIGVIMQNDKVTFSWDYYYDWIILKTLNLILNNLFSKSSLKIKTSFNYSDVCVGGVGVGYSWSAEDGL